MGALCCCPCGDEFEELSYTSNLLHRNCVSLRCLVHQLFNGYNATFHRLEGRPVSSNLQGATSLVPSGIETALTNNSLTDTGLSFSRSASHQTSQRYSRLTRDSLVFRRDKSMTNLQEDSQPLRRNKSSSSIESLGYGKKWNATDFVESKRVSGAKSVFSFVYTQPSSEDEDVCPTCLDEYTLENPKITTRCTHHFHLGCIYEWLERSDRCPICGKEMEFSESP